ncbi:NADP-dependent oxidoreductase [Maritimibacter dapengensis]|uniref:NADP-dependent oxidoreductase n=1 Tax=Maritimibacter dapengensis TaxID=2836868 RepID=A0ABS6SY39_9RHOB|nr:NADP-dependent oxidoreductase [Maritimibacter dapengensis]MBV7377819.1 NADP-dependent oxidoreductase [Maritimibacter dapengensis]
MSVTAKQIVLASRPNGPVGRENFRLETKELGAPDVGEVLIKVTAMSLDPYMRGRMDDAKSYAKPVEVDGVMEGGTVGEVLESNADGIAPGDKVFGMTGWCDHAIMRAKDLRKLPDGVPETTALGVLGMPGFTGWYGLTEIGEPKEGETLVVAAATGPVGSMVGQYAKHKGLKVIGIAGGEEKCAHAVEKFGFDACLDHRGFSDAKDARAQIGAACPDGIDIYFENVAGKVLEGVLPNMNTFGRIPICGMIAFYDTGGTAESYDLPKFWRSMLVNRMRAQGFIISDHFDRFPAFLKDVAPLVANGTIKFTEDVAEGLENAPDAFMSMLKGGNFGKQIVRIS